MESTSPVHKVENEFGEKSSSRRHKVADFFKGGLSFGALRGVSNATWIGGTAASIAAQEKLGVPWQVAAPAVGASVASIEMYGSKIATRIFDQEKHTESRSKPTTRLRRVGRYAGYVTREALGLGYSAWAGAMSAVEVNSVLKLESSKTRRMAQSATYGVGVAAWSLPIAREPAVDLAKYGFEHPVAGGAGLLASGLAIYASMEGFKKVAPPISAFVKERLGLDKSDQINLAYEESPVGLASSCMVLDPQEAPVVES